MKKTLYCLVALLAFAACTKEFETSDQRILFSVSMPEPKVAFGDKVVDTYPLLWNEGDCISVNGVQSEPLDETQAGTPSATFKVNTIESASYLAVYPASAYKDGKVTVPAWQSSTGIPDPSASVFAGVSSTTELSFDNYSAYVKITIAKTGNETIRTVKLFSGDTTPMSGNFTIDFQNGKLVPAGDNQAVAYVSNEEGMPYIDGKLSVVVCIPSGEYPKGFAVAVSAVDGSQMSRKSYGQGVTLKAGEIVAMPELEFSKDGLVFNGGDGTQGNPFRLLTSEDILKLSELSNSGAYASVKDAWFTLAADIDLSSLSYIPAFNDAGKPFTGHFDGAGYKISGIHGNGVFGYLNADVTNLSLSASIENMNAKTGALCSTVQGGTYTNVSVSGTVCGTTQVGSIAGLVDNADNVTFSGCSSTAFVEGSSCYVGGLFGHVKAGAPVLVDRCASYSNVTAQYAAGGLVGLSAIPEDAPLTAKVAYTNCVYSGRNIEVTANNGNGYGIAGGIVGWLRNNSASAIPQHILNCASYVQRMGYVSTFNGNATAYPCCGGIIGLQDKTVGGSTVEGCYSDFKLCRLYCDGVNKSRTIDNNDTAETLSYGGIYGRSSTALTYNHCYFDNSTKMGPGFNSLTAKSNVGEPGNYSSLVDKLNAWVDSYAGEYQLARWEKDARGCVVPAGMTTDSGGDMPKRISIIGDSISTYRSWIPIGYAVYYFDAKVKNGKTSDVTWEKTYWGALATRFMKDAVIEKNIAWSGSCTSSCDGAARPGFTERMASSGIGAPDIVLIHGGTNDWNRNYSGKAEVPNTAFGGRKYAYTEIVPNEVMNLLYDADIDELDTNCYLDAYVKLVRQIHAEHPNAKIVCVIGDRPDLAMVDGVIKIANHYDFCRYVDFRTRGYNNLPKFDGSHPTAAGHATIASTIYSNFGQWLED